MPIRFRHSLSEYTIDKNGNAIYKGMESVKYLNKRVGRELYKLRDSQYKSFVDLLEVIQKKKIADSRQLSILIQLDFFNEFGNPNQLLRQVDIFNTYYGAKQINKDSVLVPHEIMMGLCEKETEKRYVNVDYIGIIRYLCEGTSDIKTSILDLVRHELGCLGYISIVNPNISQDYVFVTEVSHKFSNYMLTCYQLCDGSVFRIKLKAKTYQQVPVKSGDMLHIYQIVKSAKWTKDENGDWMQIDEYEDILAKYAIVR